MFQVKNLSEFEVIMPTDLREHPIDIWDDLYIINNYPYIALVQKITIDCEGKRVIL
jgi:hypothetical protein